MSFFQYTPQKIKKGISILITIFISVSCIEFYEFDVEDQDEGLVIESYISNKSYLETLEYPSKGRYFKVILRRTSDVINVKDEYVSNAYIELESKGGASWTYTESEEQKGHYYLYDDDFKAEFDMQYRLIVEPGTGITITSKWETMPTRSTNISNIGFSETQIQKYTYQGGEKVIENSTGINVLVDIPSNESQGSIYYRWDFNPLWIYIAPYAYAAQPGYKCWVTSDQYLSDYVLHEDTRGNYNKKLFYIETHDNERIYEYFSVLITQQVLDANYYNFWKELKEQSQRGGLFDEPPFSLQSNFTSNDPNLPIAGYFGVVTENAVRWEFYKSELSYYVEDNLRQECDAHIQAEGNPPPSCYSCLNYIWGDASNQEPSWWEE